MSNIEKIRQEIERRKKRWMYDDLPIAMGRYYEDRDLLAFIDSLPEEKLPEDMEEAAEDYAVNTASYYYEDEDDEVHSNIDELKPASSQGRSG